MALPACGSQLLRSEGGGDGGMNAGSRVAASEYSPAAQLPCGASRRVGGLMDWGGAPLGARGAN